uniref:Major vault protein n=1 Tax=Strigamia maritima TaxID=126957 RepID=T1J2H3_STRMM
MASKNKAPSPLSGDESIIRIPPYYYIHVLDQTTNVTRVEIGPKTYIRHENEKILLGPDKMIIVPPRYYCIIGNPVIRDADDAIIFDTVGQAKLRHADHEVRLEQDPFPLYPGEEVVKKVTRLEVVATNTAMRIRALRDFEDKGVKRVQEQAERLVKRLAGDEWLFEGPGTYIPKVEEEVVESIRATIIKPNQALRLRAVMETVDRDGKKRVTGEEWLVKREGAYLPGAREEVVDIVDAYVLTEKTALHVKATKTFVDDFGMNRKNGEEWLVKLSDSETFIPNVYEEVLDEVHITTLTNREYCVILDPVGADGKPQLGQKKLIKGEKSFFLFPGEQLEAGIQAVYVLSENEGLVLKAKEAFEDQLLKVQRQPGDRWLIRGPCEYVPPVEVDVVTQRAAIPLDENEGIYVRDIKSGRVRAICGETYMLTENEELWAKELAPSVDEFIAKGFDPLADRGERGRGTQQIKREKTRVVTFRVPHNAAMQIYDFKEKKARVIFGPELVMLGPEEQFTQLSLSGGKPKKPNVIRSLCLLLGPDFCTDIVTVETSDHARLQLQVAYNWHFDCGNKTPQEAAKLFTVPDFVGDACKAIASRIRGAVASVQFDDFHKNSARIIRTSVFGIDENQKIRKNFTFPQNNLIVTSIDIQSVEPVDQRTRDSLQKSVQLAIEITTNSQEATARHEAQRVEQAARGRLERQRITDEAEAENARKELLLYQAASAAVESTGQAKAEAQSRAEASKIEGEAAVEQAKLKTQAVNIETEAELERLTRAREAEIKYVKEQNELEINKAKEMADIEVEKFQKIVGSLGADTVKAIATSGPEMEMKLLQSLGLQTTLITDGKSPINLFNTAHGLIAGGLFQGKPRKPKEHGDAALEDL